MKPYVLRFVIANVVLTLIAGVIAEILELRSGTGLAIGATLAASFFAASAFAKENGRAPTSDEKGDFAWRALLATWLISVVLLAFVAAVRLSAAEFGELARSFRSGMVLAIALGTLLVISTIYYVAIRWAFGWYANKVAERG